MGKKILDKVLPVEWDGWDGDAMEVLILYKVKWLSDFGIFKKGEKCDAIGVSYCEGWIKTYDNAGKVLKSQGFQVIPK